MSQPVINFFLTAKICAQMQSGSGHGFFSIAKEAFEGLGYRIAFHEATQAALLGSAVMPGYSLFHYRDSLHDRALDVRRVGIGPFYRMEQHRFRADYRMTSRVFVPAAVPDQQARSFFRIWERLTTKQTDDASFADHVLVALQGKLCDRRRGQSMSPIEMIKTTLSQEPDRDIVLKLHPKETYAADELAAIRELCAHPRIHLFEGDLDSVLATCAYVVTQNSSVVLKGVFYRKPAILFADCEYHHAFQSLRRGIDVRDAFERVLAQPPEFEKFAYWYLQMNSINTSREWAAEQIVTHAREFGWKI